jgi:hypothetical protein
MRVSLIKSVRDISAIQMRTERGLTQASTGSRASPFHAIKDFFPLFRLTHVYFQYNCAPTQRNNIFTQRRCLNELPWDRVQASMALAPCARTAQRSPICRTAARTYHSKNNNEVLPLKKPLKQLEVPQHADSITQTCVLCRLQITSNLNIPICLHKLMFDACFKQ